MEHIRRKKWKCIKAKPWKLQLGRQIENNNNGIDMDFPVQVGIFFVYSAVVGWSTLAALCQGWVSFDCQCITYIGKPYFLSATFFHSGGSWQKTGRLQFNKKFLDQSRLVPFRVREEQQPSFE